VLENQMTLHLRLTPELEARLRERAAAEGKDPATLVAEAVTEKLLPPNGPGSQPPTQARLPAWNRFVAAMRRHGETLPPKHFVDDSRESIYEGRDE
jgi:hypothetical protein